MKLSGTGCWTTVLILKKLKPEESYTTAQHEGFSIAS
jgi:hypothetical protein